PAALVVAPRLLLGVIRDLLESPAAEPVEVAALPADERDERALPPADERDERGQVELVVDLDLVVDRRRQRQRAPEVVEARREDGEPVGPVPPALHVVVAWT